ncbi:MAG: serine--tRNA ligase [Boseongicola sp. SB0665_bin_10]|nr:serine--tRNA ligase [Boseongicola sp. SB0665_bin_10]
MHDIRAIREDPSAFDAAMSRRGLSGASSEILAVDKVRRAKIAAAETAQADRNAATKEIAAALDKGDNARFERLRSLVAEKKYEIARLGSEAAAEDARLQDLLLTLPNLPYEDVPQGSDEGDNQELHRWGEPPAFDFEPAEHFDIAGVRPGMDFETAAKLSGSRFVVLREAVARVHRALAQMMLDIHTSENGLAETVTPVLVRDEPMIGTNQLPKFAEDSYATREGLWLIPTSEVTLTNTVRESILDADVLPIRLAAHTQCFRSEAGAAGKDTTGMLRQHQFEKVEMVSIVHPDASEEEQGRMLRCAEGILERLGLAYRTVSLCTGDLGFGARRTYDVEVWLPGQSAYREISSVSTCGDFQARRMNARFRERDGKPEFVHTLNGSGLAVGRALIAVLENGQTADGGVQMPEGLLPWLGGATAITPEGLLA